MDIFQGLLDNNLLPLLFVLGGAVVVYIAATKKREGYQREVVGKIRAIIKQESGFPLKKIVEIMPDNWVRVGPGDYKLPDSDEQKAAFEKEVLGGKKTISELTDAERLQYFGERMTIPSAMEWGLYPSRVFRGFEWMQVPIREQSWYYNDPRPITWLRDREPEVTSIVAQAHTRQMDALNAGNRARELDSKGRLFEDAFKKMASKTVLYGLIGASIAIGVIILIQINGGSLPTIGG